MNTKHIEPSTTSASTFGVLPHTATPDPLMIALGALLAAAGAGGIVPVRRWLQRAGQAGR
ncbi:hypothetical protein JI721_04400 [Alicyclobacillus cycloheptanicus]|uniref:PEP-CTERM protein-sorting domain-containing protein n=1 Tax=Alicyclobacillus cycloheptanicus TaxID=1457 RepID=A0ABT9XJZ4_9BACL|nr:hypothetical protein [Alicyclobacillus cycloheptanicus]MDQ0190098.1 hypothetical protein [Alicyclobacillus cycloheptanicus]WDM02072.1 hypothetical protein JI721_04400 [Alicyclobacillus cycloheptanicus]